MSPSWLTLFVLAASSGETPQPPSETAKTTAVVAMNGCAAETVTPVVRAFREALMLRLGGRVQSEVETARPLGGLGARSLADIERMLAGARVDVFQEAYDRAQRTLEVALEELGRVPPSAARWEDEREVATTLGFLFFVTGRRNDAERVLRLPLVVEPGLRPNPELYAPSFRAFAQALSGRLQRETTSRVDIATHPSGIMVYVAGRPMGKGPVSLRLPPGSYRVEGDFAGGRGLARTITVPPRGEKGEALALELRDDFEGRCTPMRDPA
jgi:hypothetical protein